FEESTTIGLRYRPAGRMELAREIAEVSTRFGKVRVKVSSRDGRVTQAQPEYEDCRRIAARRKVPLKTVQAAAIEAYGRLDPTQGRSA
ncbi:MAG TPA: nickel insertion protein, partial [Candidatus Polarisedimenticolia bacterium]|nr:nickel insertion protein [Candidatus Polarisedimenticolia bacterium]